MPTFAERFKSAWNAFSNRDPTSELSQFSYDSVSAYYRPDRPRMHFGNDRSIVAAIYNRIAMDAASISIQHVRVNEEGKYLETIDDELNQIFNLEANIDQTGKEFIQDIVISMFDEGNVAIVITSADKNPNYNTGYKIGSVRTGKVQEWYPNKVKVRVYNESTGKKEDIIVNKSATAIIENPFYAIMNEPNSTLKRLIRKMALLDAVDEQSSSGKLDLIIQLPYVIRNELKRDQAEKRRKDIEMQLAGSKYGIAYTDGTERITQLNRSVDNNLMKQIEYLTTLLYSQLGMTEEIMKGTADSKTMQNYYSRIVEPVVSAIVDECKRTFLSKTARSQGQSIMFFRDPFKLVPADSMADAADSYIRNEVLSKNEIRSSLGYKPSKDPKADELSNPNLNHPDETQTSTETSNAESDPIDSSTQN